MLNENESIPNKNQRKRKTIEIDLIAKHYSITLCTYEVFID